MRYAWDEGLERSLDFWPSPAVRLNAKYLTITDRTAKLWIIPSNSLITASIFRYLAAYALSLLTRLLQIPRLKLRSCTTHFFLFAFASLHLSPLSSHQAHLASNIEVCQYKRKPLHQSLCPSPPNPLALSPDPPNFKQLMLITTPERYVYVMLYGRL